MSSLTSIQIQALVRDMDTSLRRHKGLKRTKKDDHRKKVVEENQLLYNEFPSIFEMHYEGKLDDTFFEMLRLRRKIEMGEMTDDEASKIIGQKLFDRYVAPVVGTLPTPEKPSSYEDYYRKFEDQSNSGSQS